MNCLCGITKLDQVKEDNWPFTVKIQSLYSHNSLAKRVKFLLMEYLKSLSIRFDSETLAIEYNKECLESVRDNILTFMMSSLQEMKSKSNTAVSCQAVIDSWNQESLCPKCGVKISKGKDKRCPSCHPLFEGVASLHKSIFQDSSNFNKPPDAEDTNLLVGPKTSSLGSKEHIAAVVDDWTLLKSLQDHEVKYFLKLHRKKWERIKKVQVTLEEKKDIHGATFRLVVREAKGFVVWFNLSIVTGSNVKEIDYPKAGSIQFFAINGPENEPTGFILTVIPEHHEEVLSIMLGMEAGKTDLSPCSNIPVPM